METIVPSFLVPVLVVQLILFTIIYLLVSLFEFIKSKRKQPKHTQVLMWECNWLMDQWMNNPNV